MHLPPPPELPGPDVLTAGLTAVLRAAGAAKETVTVLERAGHVYVSTYPSEVVTCRLDGGRAIRLLCKYSADRHEPAYGHRGGVPYEAEVYRAVHAPIGVSVPRCFGTWTDPSTGWIWLVMEFLDGAARMNKTEDGPERAAGWLGGFHALNAPRVGEPGLDFLTRYDDRYYRSWAERTLEFGAPLGRGFAWLEELARRTGEISEVLIAAPATVIHGEFYGANVLLNDGIVHPIDWESAAIAPGEIDLASMTQNWPARTVEACEAAYRDARWPGGAPAGFAKVLEAARIYFLFRWLGDDPRWPTNPRSQWYHEELRRRAARWDTMMMESPR